MSVISPNKTKITTIGKRRRVFDLHLEAILEDDNQK